MIDIPWFFAYVDAHLRWPGVRQVRHALSFATPYALSPGETRLRMIVVLAGFPEPLVNVPLWSEGVLLGHPDILLFHVPKPTGLEYDGADHAVDGTRRWDLRRENRLVTRGGLPILRYESTAVSERRGLIVSEAAECTGYPTARLHPIDNADFRRPPRALAW